MIPKSCTSYIKRTKRFRKRRKRLTRTKTMIRKRRRINETRNMIRSTTKSVTREAVLEGAKEEGVETSTTTRSAKWRRVVHTVLQRNLITGGDRGWSCMPVAFHLMALVFFSFSFLLIVAEVELFGLLNLSICRNEIVDRGVNT